MNRLQVSAFATLVVATIGAFFVVQHLKIRDPLINGSPRADPPAINPISGRVCKDLAHQRVSFRRTRLNFYLQARSDTVGVYIINHDGDIVDTIASGRAMRKGRRSTFTWDGRENADGNIVAPDGTYSFKIALQRSNRDFTEAAVQVLTHPPRPDVTGVTVTGSAETPAGGPAILSPPGHTVMIHFTPGDYRGSDIQIYRTDLGSTPTLVKSFGVNGTLGLAEWNGLIKGRPAPAGTYLVGMSVVDQACNKGSFPVVIPPVPGSTPHAGVTVRYLAAEPPLVPTAAGSDATVLVDSRRQPYIWALRLAGDKKVLVHGSVGPIAAANGDGVQLQIRMPPLGAELYELAIRSGTNRTVVPVIAAAAGRKAAAHVLVVVPALTWQGANPVDDTGDGLPTTLASGDQIELDRPLVDGVPSDFPNEVALLSYLNGHHDEFQLTSDVALAQGVGPSLSGRTGVILDGSLRWIP